MGSNKKCSDCGKSHCKCKDKKVDLTTLRNRLFLLLLNELTRSIVENHNSTEAYIKFLSQPQQK
jgi:hypothetical protein